jgi:hypothetical protein
MISLTLKEFALAVGAEPKWVLNAKPRLGRAIAYTPADAEWLRLTRTLNHDLRIPLRFAGVLARAALGQSVWDDGDRASAGGSPSGLATDDSRSRSQRLLAPDGRVSTSRSVVCIAATRTEGVRLTVDLRRQQATFAAALASAVAFGEPRRPGRKRRAPAHFRAAIGRAWRLKINVGLLRARARRAEGARIGRPRTAGAPPARPHQIRKWSEVDYAFPANTPSEFDAGATTSSPGTPGTPEPTIDSEPGVEDELPEVCYLTHPTIPVLEPPPWCADLSTEIDLPNADARRTLLQRLVDHRVRFVIVGELAEALAGATSIGELDPGRTPGAGDGCRRSIIDLCYAPSAANIRRLAIALRALGAESHLERVRGVDPGAGSPKGLSEPVGTASGSTARARRTVERAAPFAPDPITLSSSTALALTMTSFGTVHLRRDVAGIGGFDDVRRRATRVRTFGLELTVLDLAALARARIATGRRSDVARLPMLETLLALPGLEDRHRELAAKRTNWIDN